MSSIPFFCGKDCGGNAWPLLATVENGCVTRVVNKPAGGRYIKGCRRGFDLPLEQYAPDRILTPLIRTGPRRWATGGRARFLWLRKSGCSRAGSLIEWADKSAGRIRLAVVEIIRVYSERVVGAGFLALMGSLRSRRD